MHARLQERRDCGFVIGLLTGTFVGAELAIVLVPRSVSELRRRMTDSARRFGKRASDQYQEASVRVGNAVDELTWKGQDVRDDVVDAGAHEVARYATAAKSDRRGEGRKQSAADRSTSTTRSL